MLYCNSIDASPPPPPPPPPTPPKKALNVKKVILNKIKMLGPLKN